MAADALYPEPSPSTYASPAAVRSLGATAIGAAASPVAFINTTAAAAAAAVVTTAMEWASLGHSIPFLNPDPCCCPLQVLSRREKVRAVLINAGQANAATGKQGYQDSLDSADAVAAALGVERDDVLLESTGPSHWRFFPVAPPSV